MSGGSGTSWLGRDAGGVPAAAEGGAEFSKLHSDLLAGGDEVEFAAEPSALGGGDIEEVRVPGVVELEGEVGGPFVGIVDFLQFRGLVHEFRVGDEAFLHLGEGCKDGFAVGLVLGEACDIRPADGFVKRYSVE